MGGKRIDVRTRPGTDQAHISFAFVVIQEHMLDRRQLECGEEVKGWGPPDILRVPHAARPMGRELVINSFAIFPQYRVRYN
jgi:hypothetical protein